jgi:archaellum biogenesis ATPase FlaH
METSSFASLLQKDIPSKPYYISGNILPKGGTMVVGGHSKIGKSFIVLNMARDLITGNSLFDCPFVHCEESKVLLVEQEIGERGLQERGSKILQKVSTKQISDNMYYISKNAKLLINEPQGIRILSEAISEIQPNVLILDPIGKLHTYNENDATEIGQLFSTFEKLKKINQSKEMAIVMTHHFKKPPMDQYAKDHDKLDPHNFRGSIRWFSDPDTIITVAKLDNNTNNPWKSWNVRMRYNLRQEESPDDMVFSINKKPLDGVDDGDGLVRYEYSINQENVRVNHNKANKVKPILTTTIKPKQVLMFQR